MLQEWIWPWIFCKLAPFSTTLNVNVSVLTLVAISLDRFYVIHYPLRRKLKKSQCLVIIVVIWLFSLVISGYNIVYYDVISDNESNSSLLRDANGQHVPMKRCENMDKDYSKYHLMMLFTLQFLIPFAILIFTFVTIFYKIYINTPKYNIASVLNLSAQNKRKVCF
jgi:hypothetical protein